MTSYKKMDIDNFVFDVSDVFWVFIRAIINNDKHSIIYSPDFVCFFVAARHCNKMSLRKNVIWLNDCDIDILDYPLNADTYYYKDWDIYVFDSIAQLLQHIEIIYYRIMNMSIINEERLNCIKGYQKRYDDIKQAQSLVCFKMEVRETENMFDRLCIHS